MKRSLLAAALLLVPLAGHAQVRQSGSVTPGHLTCWNAPSIIQDCGTPENPAITGGIGQTNGNAASIATNSQGFPNFNQLYTGVTTDGVGHIGVRSFGSAPASSLQFEIDGVVVPILPSTPLTTTDGSHSVPSTTTMDFTSGCTVSSGGTGLAHVACSTAPPPLTTTDGSTSVPNTTTLDFTVGCTVSSGGAGNAHVSCVPAITWPATNDIVISNSTNSPAGLAPSGTGCVQTVSGAPFIIGACGGAASITVTDANGTTINGVSTENFGPGFILTGTSPIGTINPNQPNRTVTACSGTPNACTVTANDMGGQVNYNGSSLTATLPAITSVTPTGTATTTALTLSSGTGVSVGDRVADVSGLYAPNTIIVSGSGTSWVTNNAPSSPISGATLTISYGGSGQGVTITNRNASNLTVTATGSAVNGYPCGPCLVPQNGGLPILSNGATWDAIGPAAPNQAFLNQNNTWDATKTQTWGPSIGPVNVQTGSTYTLQASDCGGTVVTTLGTAVSITTFATATVGCSIAIIQRGAGQVTILSGVGATLQSAHSYSKTFGQWATIGVFVDANSGGSAAEFVLTGDGA